MMTIDAQSPFAGDADHDRRRAKPEPPHRCQLSQRLRYRRRQHPRPFPRHLAAVGRPIAWSLVEIAVAVPTTLGIVLQGKRDVVGYGPRTLAACALAARALPPWLAPCSAGKR